MLLREAGVGGWEGVIAFIVIWRMNAYGYSESPESSPEEAHCTLAYRSLIHV